MTLGAWANSTAPAAISWQSVTYAPSLALWCAVSQSGTNRAMTSPDASTWTQRSLLSESWNDLVWVDSLGIFVAVGVAQVTSSIASSTDGITWTSRTSPNNNDTNCIAYSPSLGYFIALESTGTHAYKSTNGTTWTEVAITGMGVSCNDIVWDPINAIFVAVAPTGNASTGIYTSTDGLAWTARTAPNTNQLFTVCVNGAGLFVALAISGTNRCITSPDGVTWTSRTPAADITWESVCWDADDSLFIAVGASGTTANSSMTSPDGINWTSKTVPAALTYKSVFYANNLAVAVSNNGLVATDIMTAAHSGSPPPAATLITVANDGILGTRQSAAAFATDGILSSGYVTSVSSSGGGGGGGSTASIFTRALYTPALRGWPHVYASFPHW